MMFTPGQRVRTIGGSYPNRTGTFLKMAGPSGVMGTVDLDGDTTRNLRLSSLEALETSSAPRPSTKKRSDTHPTVKKEGKSELAGNAPKHAIFSSPGIPKEEAKAILSELRYLRTRMSYLIERLEELNVEG